MDVLQKWNRSIPDGNGTAAAVLFFLLFIFLKQFYLFPSGGMEAADVCLFASFFMLLCDCMRRRPERLLQLKTESLFYVFLASVLMINAYYGIRLGRGEFFKYTCFWIFNACAIWSFCYLTEYGGKAFLTGINRVVKVNIGVQLLIYLTGRGRIFREYWGAVRYQGTFNDPNQLAFFLFMMILLLYLYRCRFGDRSFPVFYVLALPVIAASKSTGILLGVLIFTVLAVLHALYRVGCRKGVAMKDIFKSSLLYDFYGELLTEHQKEIYEDFILNDLSLGEIAQDRGISRQGVHDLVKRCDKILNGYEEKLHLVERFTKTKEDVAEICKLADEPDNQCNVNRIKQIAQHILENY